MATWNIGIDETGRFDCFAEDDKSFVCAVVTRKNEKECEKFLKECAAAIELNKFQEIFDSDDAKFLRNVIKTFFHASDVKKTSGQDFLNHSMELVQNCEERKNFIEKIFISSENTEFVGSRQNYYLNSLYEVLSHIFESGLFKKKDSVNLFIAQRVLDVIGYEYPVDVVIRQMKAKSKYCVSDKEIQDIENAIKIVRAYGGDYNKKAMEKEYSDLLKDYHNELSKKIKNFIKKSYPSVRLAKIQCQSANNHVFPALADVAATLVKDFCVDDYEVAQKRRLVKGYNIQAFIESGETDAATQLIGTLFFDTPKNAQKNLEKLFESVARRNYDSVWKILTDLCVDKMRNRGTEGEDFLRTGELIALLDEFIDRYAPSPIVCARYLKMKGEYAQHSGSIDLEAASALAEKINSYLQACTDKDAYAELSSIEEEFQVESYAQVRFNSYDFNSSYYEKILEDYNKKKKQDSFYAKIDVEKNVFTDKRYSVICGTLGQALAFSGKHDEAIKYLLEDYNHSNYMKYLPASFLVVEYLRKGNLEKAIEWFKIQLKEVLKEEKTVEQFALDLNGDEKVDNWLVLNFLRLWAYSMKIDKPVVKEAVSFEKWTERKFDAYPGGLVLKWAAICNKLAKGSVETSIILLKNSIEVLKSAPEFTVKSLALSPIKVLGDKLDAEYKILYDELCDGCKSFATYAKTNPALAPKAKCEDIWEAAWMLPFNYA